MTKLSFSLDQYESASVEFMREVKTGSEQLDPILSQIERTRVSHGGTTRQVSEPTILDTPMKLSKVEATVQLDWYRRTDSENFAGFLWDLCEQFNRLEKKHFFDMLGKTTEAVGNAMDAKGMNVYEGLIEMLKKKEMRFDAEGNHGDSFIVSPAMAKAMQENPPTDEQTQRWNDTMQAKKDEYYAKKRTRRLS